MRETSASISTEEVHYWDISIVDQGAILQGFSAVPAINRATLDAALNQEWAVLRSPLNKQDESDENSLQSRFPFNTFVILLTIPLISTSSLNNYSLHSVYVLILMITAVSEPAATLTKEYQLPEPMGASKHVIIYVPDRGDTVELNHACNVCRGRSQL